MLRFIVVAQLAVCAGAGAAAMPWLAGAPRVIQEFARPIQGKSREEVQRAIVERFGPAARNIGSGVGIEQWDIESGLLELHVFGGPTFRLSSGRVIWLLETHNPAYRNLLGGFSMTTLAGRNGNRFILGTLYLGADLGYRFMDSGTNQEHRGGQAGNFFLLHPTGSFEIQYSGGYRGDTLLETVPHGTVLCRLMFKPADGSRAERYAVVSNSFSRRELVFRSNGPVAFDLSKGWNEHEK